MNSEALSVLWDNVLNEKDLIGQGKDLGVLLESLLDRAQAKYRRGTVNIRTAEQVAELDEEGLRQLHNLTGWLGRRCYIQQSTWCRASGREAYGLHFFVRVLRLDGRGFIQADKTRYAASHLCFDWSTFVPDQGGRGELPF